MTTPTSSSAGSSNGSGSTEHGNRYLPQVLGEQLSWPGAATTLLDARYRRSEKRRSEKRAIVAVGRSILVILWHPPGWVSTVQDLRSGAASGRCRDWRDAPRCQTQIPLTKKAGAAGSRGGGTPVGPSAHLPAAPPGVGSPVGNGRRIGGLLGSAGGGGLDPDDGLEGLERQRCTVTGAGQLLRVRARGGGVVGVVDVHLVRPGLRGDGDELGCVGPDVGASFG